MPIIQCGNKKIECEGIIFDKDGTLIDSFKVWPDLIKTRVKILQREIGFDDKIARLLEKTMGLNERGQVIRRSPIVVGSREQTAAAINAMVFVYLGIPWDEGMERINRAFDLCDQEMGLERQAVPIPGAQKTLKTLFNAGFKIAIATNDDLQRTMALMEYAGLAPYIYTYACRNEVREGKPAGDLFILASNRLGLDYNQCIVIGDSLLDIKMGINGGAKFVIGVLTGASNKKEMQEHASVIISCINVINVI